VVTTRFVPTHLQNIGVPYSADAIITEHFDDRHICAAFQSTHFKRLANASGGSPALLCAMVYSLSVLTDFTVDGSRPRDKAR
jgi:hypothetical protein